MFHLVPFQIEPEPHKKKVDRALKQPDAFAKYCKRQLHTICSAEKLEVIDSEELKRREVTELKKEEERKERYRKKREKERNGEYSSSSDEYSLEEMSDDGFP